MERGELRASDADRDRTAGILREHFGVGRLDQEEFDERVQLAYDAKTRADLSALLDRSSPDAGLPVTATEEIRAGAGRAAAKAAAGGCCSSCWVEITTGRPMTLWSSTRSGRFQAPTGSSGRLFTLDSVRRPTWCATVGLCNDLGRGADLAIEGARRGLRRSPGEALSAGDELALAQRLSNRSARLARLCLRTPRCWSTGSRFPGLASTASACTSDRTAPPARLLRRGQPWPPTCPSSVEHDRPVRGGEPTCTFSVSAEPGSSRGRSGQPRH